MLKSSIVSMGLRARTGRAFRSVLHQDSALTAGPLAFSAAVAIDADDVLQGDQLGASNMLSCAGEMIE